MSLIDLAFAAEPVTVEPATLTTFCADAVSARRGAFQARLNLRHVGERDVRIAWESHGPKGAPVLLVAGGISAHRHVAASAQYPEPGWWQEQVGPGRAIDTTRFRVLAIDWLGSDGTLDVALDSADQADAFAALLDHLGIARVLAFIGASYGAMTGLQFAARHPTRIQQLIAISGADRPHPFASAWRGLQRNIVALGRSEAGRREALSLARQLAMLSYRTPEEFAERFDAPPVLIDGVARCAAEDYLEGCGDRYVARTPATAFLRLSESIDLHRVAPESITVPTTVVAIEEDRLVPKESLIALTEQLAGATRLHLLRSRYGHDAFLKEVAAISAILRESLDANAGARA